MAIDMDIVNAAMVRQRTAEDCAHAGRQRRQREEDRARPGRVPEADDRAAQEPGSDEAAGPVAVLGQLAQFSTVSGIQDMQDLDRRLVGLAARTRCSTAPTLIGRTVVADGSQVYLAGARRDRRASRGAVDDARRAPARCSSWLRMPAARLIKTDGARHAPGMQDFTWDGTTDLGTRRRAGNYKIEVIANVGGQERIARDQLVGRRRRSVTLDPTTGGCISTPTRSVKSP